MDRFWINFRAYRRMCADRPADERKRLRAALRAGPICAPLPFLEEFVKRLNAHDKARDGITHQSVMTLSGQIEEVV
ncbi:hypothetical protein [Labrenzia sp. R5_0]|uniref:hypothetical protein n=1 Tax=Labrenzia sp. R5_0 TaxID=2821108 RepID=UPI001ADAAEDD|nr:hypothetical protein [Labrenzia sp. R5_0]MBO9457949.1 hypothetical protein [Labrenzia sp. R5_0]